MLVILLLTPKQDILKTTQICEELGVIWPQGGMMVENPTMIYGSTWCHMASTLGQGRQQWSVDGLFGQIELNFINTNVFMGFFHGVFFSRFCGGHGPWRHSRRSASGVFSRSLSSPFQLISWRLQRPPVCACHSCQP